MVWKHGATLAACVIAWGVALADVFSLLPAAYDDSLARLAGFVAMAATAKLMLWCHTRPIGQAYELGYDRGHRDAMREFNLKVSPIRREPNGLSDFNRTHRRRLNGSRVDA